MKNFFIFTNESKDPDMKITGEVVRVIDELGAKITGKACGQPQEDVAGLRNSFAKVASDTDCVIVLGGDGTLLRVARILNDFDVPILGINLGHLGYLTEGTGTGLKAVIESVTKDEYIIEERMMLTSRVRYADGSYSDSRIALNDVTLNRNISLRTIKFNLRVNGQILYDYVADGIIVSTPTGSTAYNLSCGGPIVEPTAKLFLITPIAPHSLNNRSLVLSSSDVIEIEIVGAMNDPDGIEYIAYADGDSTIKLCPGDSVEIKCATQVTRLVRLSKLSFLQTLKEKMS
ncbi:MAG: NAD(+)/NADH kinase [Lachnospiraceae bacterium]|nr:NAD(+)/NADH kinase [Candidatus Minthocola equi]